jgi:transcriptional regulator with XRE-family HTH domain
MSEQHWSFADVARRGALPRSTVHHLAANEQPSRPPHPQTLARLAAGLDLPVEQVRAAAARAAGFTVLTAAAKEPEVEILVAALGRLSREDRRHVAALVRSLLNRGEAGGDEFADAFERASVAAAAEEREATGATDGGQRAGPGNWGEAGGQAPLPESRPGQ